MNLQQELEVADRTLRKLLEFITVSELASLMDVALRESLR